MIPSEVWVFRGGNEVEIWGLVDAILPELTASLALTRYRWFVENNWTVGRTEYVL